ncbi:MAG: hypothetical protein K2H38_05510, partial [Muribaculaceae bacterium]|nr:hypothetical protein [Muribaculaceae bacterium]
MKQLYGDNLKMKIKIGRGVSLKYLFTILMFCFCISCEESINSIIQEKETAGFTILVSNENGFYYTDTRMICYYNHSEKLDTILYEDNLTLIRLYEPKLKISENGEIFAEKDFSDNAYKGYLDYFDGPLMKEEVRNALTKGIMSTSSEEKPHFFNNGSFVVTYDSRKFLIYPRKDKIIEALLIDDEAGDEISKVNYELGEFWFNLYFRLSDLPNYLQPKFANTTLNRAMYNTMIEDEENTLCWFSYPIMISTEGDLLQSQHIMSEKHHITLDKNVFKEKSALKSTIEKHQNTISTNYNNLVIQNSLDKAHDLEYYYEVFCNKNELHEMFGKTCYIKATINRVSEADINEEFSISFKYSTSDDLFFYIDGYSKDNRISKIHLPAYVLLKGTLEKKDTWVGH